MSATWCVRRLSRVILALGVALAMATLLPLVVATPAGAEVTAQATATPLTDAELQARLARCLEQDRDLYDVERDRCVWTAWGRIWAWREQLLRGAVITLQIAILSYALGIVVGLLGAGAKLSGIVVLDVFSRIYTTVVRAVPELLLILLLFYLGNLVTQQVFGFAVDWFFAAVFVLTFVQGAYLTEVFRGAILAIPRGQIEAARAYGMERATRFRRIVLPVMMPNALPGMANMWLILIKDTALVSAIGARELLFTASQAAGSTKFYFTFYIVVGAIYLVLTLISNYGFAALERRFRRGQSRT